MRERRAIYARRLAFWGSDEDLRAHDREADQVRNDPGGETDIEAALAAFGLKES